MKIITRHYLNNLQFFKIIFMYLKAHNMRKYICHIYNKIICN